MLRSRTYARARGVIGVFFILFGLLIGYQLISKYGLRVETISGVALAAAMIVLGCVRIRSAMAAGKPPP